MAQEEKARNDYVFERRVDFKHPDGSRTPGRIDCYRRGAFVLEAKQSAKRQNTRRAADQMMLLTEDELQRKPGQAKRGTRGWDQVMLEARRQAENYARALPVEHGYPPFLLVVDVGHVIEVYADFSGQGKNYAHFPDRQSFRIAMDDLKDEKVQARLRGIWNDPLALDPTRISAEVTRDIAERLARIAKRLEGRHDAKDVAEFLMRCLFTMFAEDVKLIPEKGFHKLLGQMKDTPEHFVAALESLWQVMDSGGYAPHLNATLKKFNGSLFKKRAALALERDDINELWIAAGKDWSDVEPAIFGTLLERALDTRERAKLGAHYTPRAYVERLVVPTIIEPLRADWEIVRVQVKELRERGDHAGALAAVKAYHHTLCTTRVLDPACGTGNFLYVSLELMKRLEGEVLEALDDLGEDQARFSMEGETVSPRQFYGLELNPRAVPIADLVLWIGYLKWQLKTAGLASITEPILHAYGTIRQQDAVIAYDARELARDEFGQPVTVWDGRTMKVHPVSGRLTPDERSRQETYTYRNPRRARWPDAEYIVGNPPFIGNKRMRERLGWGYVSALFAAYPNVENSADFVMYWWDNAAAALQGVTKGFGLVTTNSIVHSFNRRILEKHLSSKDRLSITYAIPDHPWIDATDAASVRIAMTVVRKGNEVGTLRRVLAEKTEDGGYVVDLDQKIGAINSLLQIGIDPSRARSLTGNSMICGQGIKVVGTGFYVHPGKYDFSEWKTGETIRLILGAREIAGQAVATRRIIDFSGMDLDQAKNTHPAAYQQLLHEVKPERDQNKRDSIRDFWWRYAWERPIVRNSIDSLDRYIATPETSKHRIFKIVDSRVIPDGTLFAIASSDFALFSSLHSRVHAYWTLRVGNRLGPTPRFNNTGCFDPFPFPLAVDPTLAPGDPLRARQDRLRELGERLDAFRKDRLAEHSFLTMTGLYNALERLRELENGCDVPPLTDAERDVHQAGLVSVLKEIHDDIDRAVLAAYGWDDLIPDLVGKPGATLPSVHKDEAQELAEEELLSRLVALNQERAAEEKRGLVRWLRPDYQIQRLGAKAPKAKGEHVGTLDIDLPTSTERPKWPADGLEQIRLVRDLLARAPAPTQPDAIAGVFDGRKTARRRERIGEVLETLVATGLARTGEHDGERRYFLPR